MSQNAETLRLVWIDLEMTGLNPAADTIMEIAAVVTGPDLIPLVEIERVIHHSDEMLEPMSHRVRQLHTENGLLDEVRTSTVTRAEAERAVLNAIVPYVPQGEGVLSGNSVYHDWRFLVRHMPRLEQHMHFRQIDIGTMGVLVSAWYPRTEYRRATTRHRAMADVLASIEELRYYCSTAFKVDLGAVARRR